MGHAGKHIIDPETGLCEICDEGAIRKVQQGKRPGKQVVYSNHDDESTFRSNSDEIPNTQDRYVYEVDDERTPRYARKSVYTAPLVRPRRAIYEQPIEEPIIVRRKVVRRHRTPPEDIIIHRPPPPRPTTFYYVDQDNQMVPQSKRPPSELPRRYVIHKKHPPPARTVRVVRRQIQTPPPPSSEVWHSGPRRQINSDTEIIQREQRMRHDDTDFPPVTPIKPELYYIESISNQTRHSPLETPVHMSHDNNTPPPKVIYQGNRNRKPARVEPLEQKNHSPREPTVVRRVYKKLPPGRTVPPNDALISNENHPRSVRKPGNNRPPLKHSRVSPELANRNNPNYESTKNPTIFYIRNTDEFE